MEIIHAVMNPLQFGSSDVAGPPYDRTRYAFFYFRGDHYLRDVSNTPEQIRQTYTNEGISDLHERNEADRILGLWRDKIIPAAQRPIHFYNAEWTLDAVTPELAFPLACPTTNPANIRRWRQRWGDAGIRGDDSELAVGQDQLSEA